MKEEEYLEEFNVYIKFLERTKDGTYTPIEKSSLPYVRMDIDDYAIDDYGEYYYSLS